MSEATAQLFLDFATVITVLFVLWGIGICVWVIFKMRQSEKYILCWKNAETGEAARGTFRWDEKTVLSLVQEMNEKHPTFEHWAELAQ